MTWKQFKTYAAITIGLLTLSTFVSVHNRDLGGLIMCFGLIAGGILFGGIIFDKGNNDEY